MLPTCVRGFNSAESSEVHHISKLWRKCQTGATGKPRGGAGSTSMPISRDKASLLAELAHGLKVLRKQADDLVGADLAMSSGCSDLSMESCAIPGEFNQANLSYHPGGNQGVNVVRVEACVCCNDRVVSNGELARVVRAFRARTIHAEMPTQHGRTRVGVVVEWAGRDHEFGKAQGGPEGSSHESDRFE